MDAPCGECEDCPHYQEAFAKFSQGYAGRVQQLLHGYARIKFDPTQAQNYTQREKDLMLMIIQHEENKPMDEHKE